MAGQTFKDDIADETRENSSDINLDLTIYLSTVLSHPDVCLLFDRVGTRYLGSIVPVSSPPDFPLENEPVLCYKKGSPERAELEKVLDKMSGECEEVPLVIGNEEIKTDLCRYQVMVRRIPIRLLLLAESSFYAHFFFVCYPSLKFTRQLRTFCSRIITRRKSPNITGRRRSW